MKLWKRLSCRQLKWNQYLDFEVVTAPVKLSYITYKTHMNVVLVAQGSKWVSGTPALMDV